MDESVLKQISPSKRCAEEESVPISQGGGNFKEDAESDNSKRRKTETATEEEHFFRLYKTAFGFILKTMKVGEEELENSIENVIQSFHRGQGNRFSDVDYTKSDNLCAYFYRYSQLSTELTRCKILLALEKSEELRSHFNRAHSNVMCIGGGPGFDIVGLCSALCGNTTCQKLNLSVADSAKRWESFVDIVGFLLREGDFGRSCEFFKNTNASVKFFGVSAWDTDAHPYSEALKEADVILMKGLLSILYENESKAVEAVVAGMQEGAMLLVIDATDFDFKRYSLEEIFRDYDQQFETARRYTDKAFKSIARITVFKKTGN